MPGNVCLASCSSGARASLKHDGTYNSGGYLREGSMATDDPRRSEGTVHPLVCRHPETGRPHLYLGRRRHRVDRRAAARRSRRRCWIGCGRRLANRPARGRTSGRPVISCCGTTAAPCIGVTRSTPARAGSFTGRRSRARSVPWRSSEYNPQHRGPVAGFDNEQKRERINSMHARRLRIRIGLVVAATLAAVTASAQQAAAPVPTMRGDGPAPQPKPFSITRSIPGSTRSSPPTPKPSSWRAASA